MVEQLYTYGICILIGVVIVYFYIRTLKKTSDKTALKVEYAKEEGLFEPVSLHPFIDLGTCIGSAACVSACPEKDILGIVNGVATAINTSNCIGHGACFHACPVEAISLRIGSETRGVELPHVNEKFESNVRGIYMAGEIGGMGLIKNSIEQGQQAMENIVKNKKQSDKNVFDVAIIGAGPAGISAALTAKKHGLTSVTLEQHTLGGTVYSFPRAKIVMTAPVDLPLYGKVKLFDTSKDELLNLWKKVIRENNIEIKENAKVEQIIPLENGLFKLKIGNGEELLSNNVLIAIGRRGTPRKLGIPGENLPKVSYRLLEPENIHRKNIIVVGGGDSAVESALLLSENNAVVLSYRKDKFSRIKPKNKQKINEAIELNNLSVILNSNLISIAEDHILIQKDGDDGDVKINNDLVYIFAGGELPSSFLKKAGIEITKRFGYIVKKHNK